jgi:hypothetical protein
MADDIEEAGFPALATSPRRADARQRFPLLPLDPDREARDLREHFARRGARRHAAAVLELASQWHPDVLVRDEVDFGTAVAAERLGIPCATVLVLAAGGLLRKEVVRGSIPLSSTRKKAL